MKKIAGVTLAVLLAGCVSKLDTEREPADTGSFGTTVLTLMCKRVAYLEDLNDGDGVVDVRGDEYREVCRMGLAPPADAPAALKALQAKRPTLIDSVDTIFPDDFLPDLQTFLTSNDFLAMYDDGRTIASVDDLIEMMRFMADDQEFAPALERLGHRLGYKPMTEALGTVRAVVNYPDLHDFLLEVGDQITEGGQAETEFDNLLAALGVTLRNAEPVADEAAADRTGALALDLLFSTNDLLGTSHTIPMVRRDYRGVARVSDSGGTLPLSFVDQNGDGLADIDDLGRFVDADGLPIEAPWPFALPEGEEEVPWLYRDAEGRALDAQDGALVYDYVDLDKTMFAALARDSIQLFDPQKGTALDLLRGASALMSSEPRQLVSRDYADGESLSYRGYDTSASPLLDMVYGYLQILGDPNTDDTLALTRNLIVNHQPEIARLLDTIVDVSNIGDLYPNAEVPLDSPVWDDLVPVLQQTAAVPGLLEDLLYAMEDPQVAELGLRFRDQMKYKDQFSYDADQNLTGSFSTPVDRTQADAGWNQSLMQRLLHLISDSNHAVLCNKEGAKVKDPILGITLATYSECDLLRIDNVAVFFLQSIVYNKDSNGDVIYDDDGQPQRKAQFPFTFNNSIIEALASDSMLQQMSTIDGFKHHPTPEALTRVLFLDPPPQFIQDTMDPAHCNQGDLYTVAHAGTLPVWEMDGFYDQIRPILQVYADHDAEQLFVDLLTVLNKHWPSTDSVPTHQFTNPNGANYAWGSGVESYEPIIVDALAKHGSNRGSVLDALVYGAPVLNATTGNGKPMPEILAGAIRYLITPQAGLKNRLGETSTVNSEGDPVDQFSPWQLLADAYHARRARLEEAADEGAAWQSATGNLVDVMVRADPVPTVGWTFRNPRFPGVSVALIDFLRARLAAHRAADDVDWWLGEDLPTRLEDVMSGPVFAGAADFILSLQASPDARAQIEALAAYLVNEVNYNETFRTSLVAIADVLQLSLDDSEILPIAKVAGEALRPERGWVDTSLVFVKGARHSDENQALVRMLRYLYTEYRPGHTAMGDLIDGISEVERAHPYDDLGKPYTAEDYRAMLRGLAQFLDDEKRGLRRFISIIQGRNL